MAGMWASQECRGHPVEVGWVVGRLVEVRSCGRSCSHLPSTAHFHDAMKVVAQADSHVGSQEPREVYSAAGLECAVARLDAEASVVACGALGCRVRVTGRVEVSTEAATDRPVRSLRHNRIRCRRSHAAAAMPPMLRSGKRSTVAEDPAVSVDSGHWRYRVGEVVSLTTGARDPSM